MTLSKLRKVGYELSDVNIVQADISFIFIVFLPLWKK